MTIECSGDMEYVILGHFVTIFMSVAGGKTKQIQKKPLRHNLKPFPYPQYHH